jgi:hypothetical protein
MDPDDVLVTQHPTNNPYRRAAALLYRRMIWDLQIESWRSRHKLQRLKDVHRREKAVILCNGPSLLRSDLSLLQGTYSFGLNKINLLFATSDYRPSCIIAVNPLVIEQNAAFYRSTRIPLFLDSGGKGKIGTAEHIVYLNSTAHRYFAKDCSMSLYQGATVTFVALQIAFHMGFEKVALIGADHSFQTKGPAHKTVISDERDDSHFDPNYFAGGLKWQLPDLFESEVSYTMAKNMFEAHDRAIYNCTEGGQLEIFPRLSLTDFFELN